MIRIEQETTVYEVSIPVDIVNGIGNYSASAGDYADGALGDVFLETGQIINEHTIHPADNEGYHRAYTKPFMLNGKQLFPALVCPDCREYHHHGSDAFVAIEYHGADPEEVASAYDNAVELAVEPYPGYYLEFEVDECEICRRSHGAGTRHLLAVSWKQ